MALHSSYSHALQWPLYLLLQFLLPIAHGQLYRPCNPNASGIRFCMLLLIREMLKGVGYSAAS